MTTRIKCSECGATAERHPSQLLMLKGRIAYGMLDGTYMCAECYHRKHGTKVDQTRENEDERRVS